MWIESFRYDLWPSPKRARAVKFGIRERATALLHEQLLLAGLLLVVTGWIILRIVLMLLVAQ